MTTENKDQKLPTYNILGKSGLRVFPLALGTMGYGEPSGTTIFIFSHFIEFSKKMGVVSNEKDAEKIFEKYIRAGGNFIDTANFYQRGNSERYVANMVKKHNVDRDSLIIATKYSLLEKLNPNGTGNHKKNMLQTLRESLKRLELDYIDLLYVHFWDFTTRIDQIMRQLDDVVRSGKVLHVAVSDTPAWEVARGNTIADFRGWSPFVAYQGRYSLVDRGLEQDVLPMCRKLDIGVIPWGALGQGKLTGTRRKGSTETTAVRKIQMTERDYQIQDEVILIAKELNKTPTQVALNWVIQQPGVTSTLLGARTVEQLDDCLGALDFKLSKKHLNELSNVSKQELIFPHNFIGSSAQNTPFLYLPKKSYNINV